jgi:hypothetical protein
MKIQKLGKKYSAAFEQFIKAYILKADQNIFL